MMELLVPAGNGEAVVAAVQSGADAVCLPLGEHYFSPEGLSKALHYCRARDCRAYVAFPGLYSDRDLADQAGLAVHAARQGAAAFLVRDLGLARTLRQMLPEFPLHAPVELDIHDLSGVLALHALGYSRVYLAPETDFAAVAAIARQSPVPIGIRLQGELCVARPGRCRLAEAMGETGEGACTRPCRRDLSLGGRMDSYPLSVKDRCLLENLDRLAEAGVAVGILGRTDTPPEQLALGCRLARDFLRDGKRPTAQELDQLESAFSRYGFAEGGFFGKEDPQESLSAAPRPEPEREVQRFITELRRGYTEGELRRVPVRFAARLRPGQPSEFAVTDRSGSQAACRGPVPESVPEGMGLSERALAEILGRTAGTPFQMEDALCRVEPGLSLPEETLGEIRKGLLQDLSELRGKVPPCTVEPMPATPADAGHQDPPKLIIHLSSAGQLSRELAECKPDYLYLPLEALASNPKPLAAFAAAGVIPVAVLPPVLPPDKGEEIRRLLLEARDMGVREVLAGDMGQVLLCRALDFSVRGGLGLRAANAWALQVLRETRLISATLSPSLRLAHIRTMPKPLPAELLVYGRLPVLVTDRCLIRKSAGRCVCQNPCHLSDRQGAMFPVMREFGCRNVIYDNKKLFLADRRRDYEQAGLWAVRLMMTTESPRECVAVTQAFQGRGSYRPNGLTRGRYYA